MSCSILRSNCSWPRAWVLASSCCSVGLVGRIREHLRCKSSIKYICTWFISRHHGSFGSNPKSSGALAGCSWRMTSFRHFPSQAPTLEALHWTRHRTTVISNSAFSRSNRVQSRFDQRHNYASKSQTAAANNASIDGPDTTLETIEDFNALAREGRASIQDAEAFLDKSFQAIKSLPRNERWVAASRSGGGHILRCLMDQKDPELSAAFTDPLCWFIHAEGLDGYLDKWLMIMTQHAPVSLTKQIDTECRWLRWLYGSKIKAYVNWSSDKTANSAIQELKNDISSKYPKRFIEIAGGGTAVGILRDRLLMYSALPCEAKLFTWFTQYFVSTHMKHLETETNAKSHLYHPTIADPFPMLEYVQSTISASRMTMTPSLTKTFKDFWVEKYLLRTCFLLRLRGATSQAEWLELIIRRGRRSSMLSRNDSC